MNSWQSGQARHVSGAAGSADANVGIGYQGRRKMLDGVVQRGPKATGVCPQFGCPEAQLGRTGSCNRHGGFLLPPCVTSRLVVVSLRGPGQSPVLPFACCVELLLSVGRCGRCSCWCRCRACGAQWLVCWGCWCHFRVRGAQWLVCWGCAGCGMVCRLRGSGAHFRLPPPPPVSIKQHSRQNNYSPNRSVVGRITEWHTAQG